MLKIIASRLAWAGKRSALLFSLAIIAAPSAFAMDAHEPSVDRGGRLYDDWALEIDEDPRNIRHPSFPAEKAADVSAARTWLCAECHGWDYKGRHGIKGVDGAAGKDQAAIIAVLKDKTHGYGDLMDPMDFQDLAAFVAKGQVDMDAHIDRATGKAKGDGAKQIPLYKTMCVTCHGVSGDRLGGLLPLARTAWEKPRKTLHKLLNGHPGENMPALRVLGVSRMVETMAYLQTLPKEEPLPSIVRGGQLYDNWMKEVGLSPPRKSHPTYPPGKAYSNKPAVNWRCHTCHGWDYKGATALGMKGIAGMAGAAPEKIIAVLTDKTHRYGDVIEDRGLLDLANFVSKGQVDMDKHIDPATAKAKGDKAKGKKFYRAICNKCHGPDGRKITTMTPLGDVARSDPWNALHKVLNGHPKEEMPALRVLDRQVAADLIAYTQSLVGMNTK